MPEPETLYLRSAERGRWDSYGINRGPAGMELVRRTGDAVVFFVPGHNYNSSGIRGMRHDNYTPARFIVFRMLEAPDGPDANMRVEKVCDFPVKWRNP